MKSFHRLLAFIVGSLLICTSCVWPMAHDKGTKPYPIAVPVKYASATKTPPDHAASPAGQPDKNLKIQKVTVAWTQPGTTKPTWSYKLHQGGSSGTYTNSVLTLSTNAVCYAWPGKTYYFDVLLMTDTLDSNGLQETVHCENPYELVYTVPSKPGGPK